MTPPRRASAARAAAVAAAACATALLAPAALAGQTAPPTAAAPGPRAGRPRLMGGLALSIAQPVHDFRDYVANGVGAEGYAVLRPGPASPLALRAAAGFVNYGRERRRISLFPGTGRFTADLTTTNNIFWLGVGPQLMAPSGPVRPYANAEAGFAYFSTRSSLTSRRTDDEIASEENQSDFTWSAGGGGGVLVPLSRSARQPWFLDLGARYHRNGRVRYLRRGGVVDLPDGTTRLDVIESAADLWTYRIGVTIGGW